VSYLLIIATYSAAQIALGVYVSRRLRGSSDFFVAGRALGPGMLAATLLAANIGGGSTIGAAGRGFRDGIAAWWWVGSAGFGSIVLAWWIGPRIRRIAAEHDLKTVGDFLEWRYDARVRATIAVLLWAGAVAILAGQLLSMSVVFTAAAGFSKTAGCVIAAAVATAYFAAGGLKSSVAVNVLQVTVKLLGFAIGFPLALSSAGGFGGLHAAVADPGAWNVVQNGASGWIYVPMLTPAFIVSPGLLQKVYGARDDRTVRIGVGVNAAVLLSFAAVPPLLGMVARALHPDLPASDLALPTVFVRDLPFWIGGLGLAAIFSAEVSAADAILFMLATSFAKDLYQRFVRPDAGDARVLAAARVATVAGAALAIGVALGVAKDVVDALGIFYTLLSVGLFVPVVAGLYSRRPGAGAALASIAAGVATVVALQIFRKGAPIGVWTPAMLGIAAAMAAFGIVSMTGER
jgi:SSS family solute:Na+ symporter